MPRHLPLALSALVLTASAMPATAQEPRIQAADRAFAASRDLATQWIGELLFSEDGQIVGVISDLALEEGRLSHAIVKIEQPDGGESDLVAVPMREIDTVVDRGIRRHVADATEAELQAPIR